MTEHPMVKKIVAMMTRKGPGETVFTTAKRSGRVTQSVRLPDGKSLKGLSAATFERAVERAREPA